MGKSASLFYLKENLSDLCKGQLYIHFSVSAVPLSDSRGQCGTARAADHFSVSISAKAILANKTEHFVSTLVPV